MTTKRLVTDPDQSSQRLDSDGKPSKAKLLRSILWSLTRTSRLASASQQGERVRPISPLAGPDFGSDSLETGPATPLEQPNDQQKGGNSPRTPSLSKSLSRTSIADHESYVRRSSSLFLPTRLPQAQRASDTLLPTAPLFVALDQHFGQFPELAGIAQAANNRDYSELDQLASSRLLGPILSGPFSSSPPIAEGFVHVFKSLRGKWTSDTAAGFQPHHESSIFSVLKAIGPAARASLAASCAEDSLLCRVVKVGSVPVSLITVPVAKQLSDSEVLLALPPHTATPCIVCAFLAPLFSDYETSCCDEQLSKAHADHLLLERRDTSDKKQSPKQLRSNTPSPRGRRRGLTVSGSSPGSPHSPSPFTSPRLELIESAGAASLPSRRSSIVAKPVPKVSIASKPLRRRDSGAGSLAAVIQTARVASHWRSVSRKEAPKIDPKAAKLIRLLDYRIPIFQRNYDLHTRAEVLNLDIGTMARRVSTMQAQSRVPPQSPQLRRVGEQKPSQDFGRRGSPRTLTPTNIGKQVNAKLPKSTLHFSLKAETTAEAKWVLEPQDAFDPKRQTMQEWAAGRVLTSKCHALTQSADDANTQRKTNRKSQRKRPASKGKTKTPSSVSAPKAEDKEEVMPRHTAIFKTYASDTERAFVELCNGSGKVCYPSGRTAIVVSWTGHGNCLWAYDDQDHASTLASFSPIGGGCVYYNNDKKSLRVLCDAEGVSTFSEDNALASQHTWREPGCVMSLRLNENINLRIHSRRDVTFEFEAEEDFKSYKMAIKTGQQVPVMCASLAVSPVRSAMLRGLQSKAGLLLDTLQVCARTVNQHVQERGRIDASILNAQLKTKLQLLSAAVHRADSHVRPGSSSLRQSRPATAPSPHRGQSRGQRRPSLGRPKTAHPHSRKEHKTLNSSHTPRIVTDSDLNNFHRIHDANTEFLLLLTTSGSESLASSSASPLAQNVCEVHQSLRTARNTRFVFGFYPLQPQSILFKRNKIDPGTVVCFDVKGQLRFVGHRFMGRPFNVKILEKLLDYIDSSPTLPIDFKPA